jgi:hypothetical protein
MYVEQDDRSLMVRVVNGVVDGRSGQETAPFAFDCLLS